MIARSAAHVAPGETERAEPASRIEAQPDAATRPWKIAFVDDDESVHALTHLTLAGFSFRGRPLQIRSEYSAKGARRLLREDPDIAVVILDVVMETDQAGLDLVRYIRDDLNNSLVRIILRTGHPARAPERQVISEYDINDYKEKSELKEQKLITSVTAALRAFDDLLTIQTLATSNESLERMVRERTRALEDAGATLHRSRTLLAEAQRIASIGNFEWDLVSGDMTWSDELYRIFGTERSGATLGLDTLLDATAPEDRDALNRIVASALGGRRRYEIEHRIVRRDGREGFVLQRGEVHCDAAGAPARLVGTVQDITERRQTEDTMRKLSLAVEQTADSVMITDRNGAIEYVNPAFTSMTGYAPEDVLGKTPRLLNSGQQDDAYFRRLWEALLRGEVFHDVVVNRRKDGSCYHESLTITPQCDSSGQVTHFVATGRDVSEWMEVRNRIEHLAHHDALTGLPNRTLLMDRLEQAIARAKWRQRHVAVAFLDLDRFKVINDTLGHDVGDRLLKGMAERLVACVREGDTVARLGGDEFAIILNDIAARSDVALIAGKIVEAMRAPFALEARELFATTSIGISMYPEDGGDGQTLLKHADAAMYGAKAGGKNDFQFYAQHDESAAIARLDLETGLRRALEQRELFLAYQPQLDTISGTTIGVEALLRWRHPDGRVVMPRDFMPLLEETGMILEVGDWVLETACIEARSLRAENAAPCRVAVNVSPRQFRQKGFADRVAAILRRTGFAAPMLELEVTEGVLTEDARSAADTLQALHALGVRLSIDDFGTGCSSMRFLGRLPFDALKIDQSFVGEIPHNRESAAVVAAVVSLAKALGMESVAEGVSTEEQMRFVGELGCHLVQGHLLSPPLTAAEYASFARQAKVPSPAPRPRRSAGARRSRSRG
jgi:diguanylate cyclase (GGDEF)-like protein/PAS domain S-box-containing protein